MVKPLTDSLYPVRVSGRTAIARSKPGRCASWVQAHATPPPPGSRILHHGAGRPNNADREFFDELYKDSSVVHYDPCFGDKNLEGRFDRAISIYVFNTLPERTRRLAWEELFSHMSSGADLFVALRGRKSVERRSYRQGWMYTPGLRGWITGKGTFQAFLTPEGAIREAETALPKRLSLGNARISMSDSDSAILSFQFC